MTSLDSQALPRVKDAAAASLLQCVRGDALNLVLVRHGQRGGLPVEGLLGKSLTPLGWRQARRVARRLMPLPMAHLYTSDMARAYQTAQALRELRPEVPFTVLEELREGRGFHPPFPPATTPEELAQQALDEQRVASFVQRVRSTYQPGQIVVAIAHGGVIRRTIAALSGVPINQCIKLAHHNTGVTVVSIAPDGRPVLRLANCTRHLLPSQIGGDVMP